jgi:organic radical activating enzyme
MFSSFTVNQSPETLIISEMFGPTLQGEGPSCGVPALFIRLGRCNLDCDWCDTPFTWDWAGKNGTVYEQEKELNRIPVYEVVEFINTQPKNLMIVITGGEPLIQSRGVEMLTLLLPDRRIEIETNGTRPPLQNTEVDYNVSPKLSNSGVVRQKAWRSGAIEALKQTGRVNWKFVIANSSDVDEVNEFVKTYGIPPWRVWLMPEGKTAEKVEQGLKDLAPIAIEYGFRLSGRQHVTIWGDKRGH